MTDPPWPRESACEMGKSSPGGRSKSKLIVIFAGVYWPAWTTSSSPACRPRGRCGLPAPVTAVRSPCTPAQCCCPLPGQDRRRRVRHPALAGLADPLPLPRARRQGPGSPDGPPADPQLRPAAAGPPAGGPGPDPRRDRPQAGRVPVPDLRADQAARHAARPGLPVRGRRHRGRRFRRAGCPRRRRYRTRAARRRRRRRRAGHRKRRSHGNRRGRRRRAGNRQNRRPGRGGRGLGGGEEDRVRDCCLPVCGGDAGARLHQPGRRPGPAEVRDRRHQGRGPAPPGPGRGWTIWAS